MRKTEKGCKRLAWLLDLAPGGDLKDDQGRRTPPAESGKTKERRKRDGKEVLAGTLALERAREARGHKHYLMIINKRGVVTIASSLTT